MTKPVLLAALLSSLLLACPARAEEAGPPEYVPPDELVRRALDSPDQMGVGESTRFPLSAAQLPALQWAFQGPRPVLEEYWSGTQDASGRVTALLVDPRDANVVYAAAAQGGVWKTTDGGAHWTPLTESLSSLASGALAFDPANPDVVYYGTGEQHFCGDCYYGDGLFKSTDAGASWTKLAAKGNVGSYIARVAIPPGSRDTILVASERGLVRSVDGGLGWTVTLSGNWCTDVAVDPVTPANVYAALYGLGIYKSTDGGVTFSPLLNGLPTTGFTRINFGLSPSNPLVLYAGYSSTNHHLFGMFRTSDGGALWTNLGTTPDYLGGQGFYDHVIAVHPSNPNVCYAGGVFPYQSGMYGLIATSDGGATWNDVTIGSNGVQVHPDQHAIAFGPDGALWLGNDGGVWKSTDGGTHWTNRNHDLGVTQFYTLALHPTDPNVLLGGNQDNGTLRYSGSSGWPQIVSGDGGPCLVDPHDPAIWYTTYVNMSDLYKFRNGNYVGEITGPWGGDRASWCNGPLIADPNAANTLLVGTHRVWKTTNGGTTWTAISGDLAPSSGVLRSLAVANGFPNTIYAGSSNGYLWATGDGGSTWTRRTGLPAVAFPDVVLHPSNPSVVYLCADRSSSGRVYGSTTSGVTWNDLTGDLPTGLRAMSLALDFRPVPPEMFLGTDYGVYSSADGGAHWVKESSAIPGLAVYDLGVDATNSLVVAATHGRGMWRAALDVTPPAVAVTSPVGGEDWGIGSPQTITWTATDASSVDSVRVECSYAGAGGPWEVLAGGVANTGSLPWTVPDRATDQARVRVTAFDHRGNVGSAAGGDFTILGPTAVDEGAGRLALAGVRPNPTRGSATLRFSLPAAGAVRAEVLDLGGRRLWARAERLAAGAHAWTWDGTTSSGDRAGAGLYFVRLVTPWGMRGTRLVVLR